MDKQEAMHYVAAWEAAKPLSEMDLKEDFQGGVKDWQVRMDREGWYLKHEPCGTLEILSTMTTPPRLVKIMEAHNEKCTASTPLKT